MISLSSEIIYIVYVSWRLLLEGGSSKDLSCITRCLVFFFPHISVTFSLLLKSTVPSYFCVILLLSVLLHAMELSFAKTWQCQLFTFSLLRNIIIDTVKYI